MVKKTTYININILNYTPTYPTDLYINSTIIFYSSYYQNIRSSFKTKKLVTTTDISERISIQSG